MPHPFPSRRSSDLGGGAGQRGGCGGGGGGVDEGPGEGSVGEGGGKGGGQLGVTGGVAGAAVGGVGVGGGLGTGGWGLGGGLPLLAEHGEFGVGEVAVLDRGHDAADADFVVERGFRGTGEAFGTGVPCPRVARLRDALDDVIRSEEHTSALQSQMRNSYAVFCSKNKN